jgi:hypothetical protein
MSPAFPALNVAWLISTFSCVIAYSERPAASRAAAGSVYEVSGVFTKSARLLPRNRRVSRCFGSYAAVHAIELRLCCSKQTHRSSARAAAGGGAVVLGSGLFRAAVRTSLAHERLLLLGERVAARRFALSSSTTTDIGHIAVSG